MNNIKKIIIVIALFLILTKPVFGRAHFFDVQSIDTMKYSRDAAREKLKDLQYDKEIDMQVKNIADTGATHIALGTPYDEEFLPYLKRWVAAARKNNLKVWLRGNLSGWEEWFGYPAITKDQHTARIRQFILNNPDLFENGDIFSSCPECENGALGDPRMNDDVEGYKNFLINEYQVVKQSFTEIHKNVIANYYSMNGDVARLIMNVEMTKSLDGAVTIDHYVKTPDQLVGDIKNYIEESHGSIILGEFGAPIPDIHGNMTEKEQAQWIDETLKRLIQTPQVTALNYWTNMASSTSLWNEDYSPRRAVSTVTKYFDPINIFGIIKDERDQPLGEVTVKGKEKTIVINDDSYALPVLDGESVTFSKYGYVSVNIKVNAGNTKDVKRDITLVKIYPSPIYNLYIRLLNFFKSLFK